MNYPSLHKKPGIFQVLGRLVKQQIAERRLHSVMGYTLLALVATAIAFAVAKIDERLGIVIIAGLLGGTAAFVCLFNTKLGFYLTITVSFFMFFVNRMMHDALPVGAAIDVMILFTFIGIYFRKTMLKEKYWQHSRNPITAVYFLTLAYLLVQVFNPSMDSVAGWVFAIRKFINFLMIFYIALHIFDSYDNIKEFIKLWLGLCFVAGVYGCFQEWHGLLGFEERWVNYDPLRYKLYFQAGHMRKFSILSDPTAFGILMADAVIFILVLMMGNITRKMRNTLLVLLVPIVLGMAYSGTRTANAMLPAGLIIFVLMTITSKKTLAFTIAGVVVFIVVLFGPFHNPTIQRVRSTFMLSEDGSYNERDINRQSIQPYMLRHPIGGGPSTSGIMGLRYNPHHVLAGFPPDSGYLHTAMELGWVGLALTCFTYFIVMWTGIRNYYRSRSPEIKAVYLAVLAALYGFMIANYAQVAIGQVPGCFFFFAMLAMLVKLITFDKPEPQKNNNSSV